MHSAQGRYKLRVSFVSTDAYGQDSDIFPYRKLLYLAHSDQQVGQVRQDISRLYHKMHPSDHFHQVACLRDSQMFDVPDDYLVSEVFDECPEIYAALTGLCLPPGEEMEMTVGSSSASTVGGVKRKRYVLEDNSEPELVKRLKTYEPPFTSPSIEQNGSADSKQTAIHVANSLDDEEITLSSKPTEEVREVPKPIPPKSDLVKEASAPTVPKPVETKDVPEPTSFKQTKETPKPAPKQTDEAKDVRKPAIPPKQTEAKEVSVPTVPEPVNAKKIPRQTEVVKEVSKPTVPKLVNAKETPVPAEAKDTSNMASKLESLAEEIGDKSKEENVTPVQQPLKKDISSNKTKEETSSSSSEEEEDSSLESSSEEETTSSEEEESETEDDILKSLRVLKDKMDHQEPPIVIKKEEDPPPATNPASSLVKKQRPPALALPKNPRRQSGVLELAKSQKNSPAGIMSISQMASAKPYDELRKKMAIQAASRSAKSNPTTPVALTTKKKEAESSSEDDDSSSDSDSDSSSGEEEEEDNKMKTPVKRPPPMPNGSGTPKGKPIRFANGKLPTDSAKTKKKPSLLKL